MDRLHDTLYRQAGTVSRRQALELGLSENDLRRLLRRRELVHVLPGVYVAHTGPVTYDQRAWAAVLHAWPAALSHESAIRAANSTRWNGFRHSGNADVPIHVAIEATRTISPVPGIVLHRMRGMSEKVQWRRSPPRVRVEDAALDLASAAASDFDAVAVLADVVSSRRTTATRMLDALASRKRIGRRAFLRSVLHDVEAGTCSVLEHGYLDRVERAHGLPEAVRQVIDRSRGTLYRDVLYEEFRQIVELDGRIFHTGARKRDKDMDRDLDATLDQLDSVRLGWGQVFDRPCATAGKVGLLLRSRGWKGRVIPCPECSSV